MKLGIKYQTHGEPSVPCPTQCHVLYGRELVSLSLLLISSSFSETGQVNEEEFTISCRGSAESLPLRIPSRQIPDPRDHLIPRAIPQSSLLLSIPTT